MSANSRAELRPRAPWCRAPAFSRRQASRTALAVLRLMADTGRDPADLASALVSYPQTLVNVRVRDKREVTAVPPIASAMTRVSKALGARGRLLVRYSGTEPLLRIMIEGEDQATIQAWAEEIAEAVRAAIG